MAGTLYICILLIISLNIILINHNVMTKKPVARLNKKKEKEKLYKTPINFHPF
jgi:hypothetical protein